MKKIVALAAAIAAFGCVNSANAADMATKMPVKAPPPPIPVYDWGGLYVGGNIGYGWGGRTDPSLSFIDPGGGFGLAPYYAAGGNVTPNLSPKGVLGGAQIGYNWNVAPRWVAGLVADIQAADIKASGSNTVTPTGLGFVTTVQSASIKTDWFGTVRGKVGYALDNWLIYGTGGLAYGHVSTSGSTFFPPGGLPGFPAGTSSSTRAGWTAGGGIDFAISRNWTVGVEYLHVDLGDISTTQLSSPAYQNITITTSQKVNMNIARLTANYKF